MMPGQRVHQVPKYVTAVEFESATDRMRARGFKAEGSLLVGAIGFEPTTPCAQGRCATRLRYAPTRFIINEAPCATFVSVRLRPSRQSRKRAPFSEVDT